MHVSGLDVVQSCSLFVHYFWGMLTLSQNNNHISLPPKHQSLPDLNSWTVARIYLVLPTLRSLGTCTETCCILSSFTSHFLSKLVPLTVIVHPARLWGSLCPCQGLVSTCVPWFLPVPLYCQSFGLPPPGFCMSPLFPVWWFGLMLLFSSSCLCLRLQAPLLPPASGTGLGAYVLYRRCI